MIDISHKIKTLRTAKARATLKVKPETIDAIHMQKIPKGDPLTTAKVAAIQSAKSTSGIIPYCHPLPLDYVGVEFELGAGFIHTDVTVKAVDKTGVEMEALTAAAVAALTLYDMLKMLDDTMEIVGVKLLEKSGGKSDFKAVFEKPLRAAVVVMSDSVAHGSKSDVSGQLIVERLNEQGVNIVEYKVIPDDIETILSMLARFSDVLNLDLIVTAGGTGLGPRDCVPEAMAKLVEREIPGISESARAYGQERTPYSMLSRAKAGVRGKTLIVNLPGSRKGITESLDAIFPGVLHTLRMIRGEGH